MNVPRGADAVAVASAALVWLGASGNRVLVVLCGAGIAVGCRRRPTRGAAVMLLVVGAISGSAAAARETAVTEPWLPAGRVVLTGIVGSDPAGPAGSEGFTIHPDHLLVSGAWEAWPGPRLYVRGSAQVATGEPVLLRGIVTPAEFRARSGPVSGVVVADRIERLGSAPNALLRVANRLRRHVLGSLDALADRPEGALVAGFLIGDTRGLPDADYEALRLAGLSHFVAVSGSNVALFLAAWWLATGPLGWGPRRRAVIGLIGIALFAVVTRWEPSVVRASLMAAAVLIGRLIGVPMAPWSALGWAVTGVVALSGGIVHDVGFQLSVAATVGLILGGPLWAGRRPRWMWTTIGATLSAQAAVAPILLHHFGSVPLMAPLSNLLAAPLVVAATALGGIGTLSGMVPLVRGAARVALVVLVIARDAADLPQLHTGGVVAAGVAGLVAWRYRSTRAVLAIGCVLLVGASLVPTGPPAGPTAVFLDVGQGDAELLLGPSGEVILIDGGPDPALLRSFLRERGVSRIDLLIVSHHHADHTTALVGITAVARVDRLWYPPQLGEGSPLDVVVTEVAAAGGDVAIPAPGTVAGIGAWELEVLGPLRRYESPNDGSIVVLARAAGRSVLLSGDVEAIAQHDLGPIPADVMKVPHQGAITSDLTWLADSAPSLAVISVGANDFGHPSAEVIRVLEEAGARVMRTDRDGTITVRLDRIGGGTAVALPSAG
ncbi:MAG: hypothetical protein A2Z12_02540 [Actinobacteria bacterium RBG_16_68_21]|nr:MAG: hypothetical protein A2Z12_02540 [Actinobacteria bacterium RBG_16_68_21]